MSTTPGQEGEELPFCICGGDVHGLHVRECPWYERADDCPQDHMRWSLTDEEYARACTPTLLFSKSRPLTDEEADRLFRETHLMDTGQVLPPGHELIIVPGSPVKPRDIRMARVHRATQQAIATYSAWRTAQLQQMVNPSLGDEDEQRVETARIEHEQKEQALSILTRRLGWQEGDRARNSFGGNGPFANVVGTLERSMLWDRFTLMLDEPVRWFDFEGKPHVEDSCIVSADKLIDLEDCAGPC